MTHEQSEFRRRIDRIWQMDRDATRSSQDGSVAVYASALQDVVNLFRDRPGTVHGVAVDVAAMEAIADYAEAVGLEVTL